MFYCYPESKEGFSKEASQEYLLEGYWASCSLYGYLLMYKNPQGALNYIAFSTVKAWVMGTKINMETGDF
jgi:hypothetical protein